MYTVHSSWAAHRKFKEKVDAAKRTQDMLDAGFLMGIHRDHKMLVWAEVDL